MPDKLAMARNSSLRGLLPGNWEDHVKITLLGQRWWLEYETFANSGTRYFLLSEQQPNLELACAASESRMLWQIQCQGQEFELMRKSRWKFSYHLTHAGEQLGELRETTRLLGIRRYFELKMECNWPIEIQVFLFYLGVIQVYR